MRFRAFLASFSLPMIAINHQRRVVLWNAAAEQLLGWPAPEVIGREDPSVPPEVAAENKTLWEAALRGEPAVQRESVRITRNGDLLDVLVSTSAVPSEEDDELSALMMLHDVTEERAAEERLAERESQLRLMLEQLPAIISTLDQNLVVTSVRGAGLRSLGVDSSEFVGKVATEIVPEGSAPIVSLRAALRGQSSSYEYEFRGRWYECRTEPLCSRDGTIVGAINLGFDVTERRRAEIELGYR